MKCASFFAGVGGIDKGFESVLTPDGNKAFEVIYANEFDPSPVKTYQLNSKLHVDCRDIRNVKADEIPDFDIMLAGFPCQAFSIAGYRQGFADERGRGTLFFELIRIIKEKQPSILFLENVKALVTHDNGHTFHVILHKLKNEGYHIKYKVLNAMNYGNIPQTREGIYLCAFKNQDLYQQFSFPAPIPLKTKLTDIIDFKNKADEKYYYYEGKFKGDIFEKLKTAMDDPMTVYQWRRWYVRKNMNGVVPTLTASMGTGGHNVGIVLTRYGIRKLTPRECFNAQGFPPNFLLPDDISDARLYKQAGNSVCVSLIHRIAEQIENAINALPI